MQVYEPPHRRQPSAPIANLADGQMNEESRTSSSTDSAAFLANDSHRGTHRQKHINAAPTVQHFLNKKNFAVDSSFSLLALDDDVGSSSGSDDLI